MISIIKGTENDAQLLTEIATVSFIESQGHSAAETDINKYVNEKFTYKVMKRELTDPKNIYHLIYIGNRAAGYSKIIFDAGHVNISLKNITKLDRIYLLQEFYNMQAGVELLNFNIGLSKTNAQAGMWLFAWKENHRAVNFYKKNGFEIIGSYDFKLTENHSNPNHQMLLRY